MNMCNETQFCGIKDNRSSVKLTAGVYQRNKKTINKIDCAIAKV